MQTPASFSQSINVPAVSAYDVIVVGGGIAGCAAALAAVREGKSVLLLEKMTMLGGLGTAGHIVIYLPLCDGYGRQVIGGIAEELLLLSTKYSFHDDVAHWRENGKRYETRYDGPAYALALEELLEQSGVAIFYDTLAVTPIMQGRRCKAVVVENKSGREYENIVAHLTSGSPLLIDAQEGRIPLSVILGVYESSRSGKAVCLL